MATESDKLNTGAIATLVAVLTLTMVAIVAVLTAMVRQEVASEVTRKGGTASSREYRDLAAEQHTLLTREAQWVDRDAGVLSIPIERAMNLVVADLRREPTLATAVPADAGTANDGTADNGTANDGTADASPNENAEADAVNVEPNREPAADPVPGPTGPPRVAPQPAPLGAPPPTAPPPAAPTAAAPPPPTPAVPAPAPTPPSDGT